MSHYLFLNSRRCYTIIIVSVKHCGRRSELALMKPTFHTQYFFKDLFGIYYDKYFKQIILIVFSMSDTMGLINDTQPQHFP